MALQHELTETTVGIPAPAAYTVITNVSVERQKIFGPPAVEGGEAPLLASHKLVISTESFASKQAKDDGKNKIGYHQYQIAYPYDATSDPLTYAYNWLKTTVPMFSTSQDV